MRTVRAMNMIYNESASGAVRLSHKRYRQA